MARYCGDIDTAPILAAAQHWRQVALEHDGSVFSGEQLWCTPHLEALQTHFVDAPDEGEGTFFGKFELQLAATAPGVKQLAAEMLWVMSLCPSNVTLAKKRESILQVWGWSGASAEGLEPWLRAEILHGIGSAGASFAVWRWRELAYFIRLMLDLKALSHEERTALLGDAWTFADWLERVPDSSARQLRHMLLFLLFPDSFERIFGGGDRRLIVQRFSGMTRARVRKLTPLQIDRELAKIRAAEELKHPQQQLDFYENPLNEQWQTEDFDSQTAAVEREHVLAALKEIDDTGVPPDAESTVYDLIHGSRRYPPKLVLSLASKHAGGKAFDRSMFSGGIDSSAFSLLRTLGFHIERKDFVPGLLRQFLAQANEGSDLSVRGYADAYRGLAVRVSFGKGTPARVPWIAFLGEGQETQRGIYPALLYYRDASTLMLTRCISDTDTPGTAWPADPASETVEQYFERHFGRSAERYGNSTVVKAYRLPVDMDEAQVNVDLDALITEYQTLLEQVKPLPAEKGRKLPASPDDLPAPPHAAEEPERPYTVKEATEALFIPQDRFEQILAIWRKKRNLVVQGPPGVGKTFFFRRLAYALMGAEAPDRLAAVQFHPSYAYEDFVEGFRPSPQGFALRAGAFSRFCERARADAGRAHVFVIDEINRGNLAKIFGELLMLMESDKRGPDWAVPLAYSGADGAPFFVPSNVYLLGLMNTADRSLAVVDYALRRRFAFVTLEPAYDTERFREHLREKGVVDTLAQKIIAKMTSLNSRIAGDHANLGPGFCIGHSFFCDPPESTDEHQDWYRQVVDSEIAPLLREYYFDDVDRARSLIDSLQ